MKRIYLDNAATTPLCREARLAMRPWLTGQFGNADSRHAEGRRAALVVRAARDGILQLLGGNGGNLYFTSGGSEANSWALKGVCAANFGKKRRIVISAIEHPSLIRAAEDMAAFGFETTLVYPDSSGIVSPQSVKEVLSEDVAFVGVMYANNETGVVQPAEQIYCVCRQAGAFYFCDCVQAAGAVPLDCNFADGISISAHKFCGPQGVGALWLKRGVKIDRLISGGQQEGGMRGGTTYVAGVCGMYAALARSYADMPQITAKISSLRDEFLSAVLSGVPNASLVGSNYCRLACNANIMFSGFSGERLLLRLDTSGVAASAGSACSSGAAKPSYVLTAMGLSEEQAASCVRFSFGRENTRREVLRAAQIVVREALRLYGEI